MSSRVSARELIGRANELAELEAAFGEAAAGGTRLALLSGESGVGKTRLLGELLERARAAGGRTFGGECVGLGGDEIPYAPLVAAVRGLVRDCDPVLDELTAGERSSLGRLVPELGEPPRSGQDEDSLRRPLEALLSLLERLAEKGPVVLWIDDAQWADRSTRHFLAYLSSLAEDLTLLIIVAYRSEELGRRHPMRRILADLGRGERVRRLELAPFGREELTTQLRDILGSDPPPAVVDRFFERSEGNPLFTEELLAARSDGRGGLPSTLRDALLLRVERLPESALTALQVLAPAGRLDQRVLAEVSDLDEAELAEGLREAVAAQVLVVGDDDRIGFRHALLREVIYEDLLPGERAELHLGLARALEAGLPTSENPALVAATVAHHFHAAEEQPEALRSAVQAAFAAEGVRAPGTTAALLDRALALWRRVPEPEARAGIDHVELLRLAARAHSYDADEPHAISLYEEALEELDEGAEPARAAETLTGLSAARWALGQADAARDALERALRLLPESEPTPERARILEQKARFLLLQGRYDEATEAGEEALAAAEAAQVEETRAGVLNRLGLSRFFFGEEEAGIEAMRESLQLARRYGSNDQLCTAFVNYADALHFGGRTEEALRLASEGQETISGGDRSELWIACLRSELLFELGRWQEAEAALPRSGGAATGMTLCNLLLRRATLALGRGDLERARDEIARVEETIAEAVEPQYIAPAGMLAAELERRSGDTEAARRAIDRAIDRIEFCSDDPARMAQIAAAGVAVEADAAEGARDRGDAEALELALSRAELMAARCAAAEPEEGTLPYTRLISAYARSAEAELARARSDSDAPERALAAARAWEELGRPYPAAVERWRAAAALTARGERREAAAEAASALAVAERLGAAWLAEEAAGLIARGRLPVADQPAGAGDGEADRDGEGAEDPFGLTPRERQVLTALAAGATNREIGAQLFMAEKTASVHVSRILGKLGVRSRTEAAAVAHRNGLSE